MNPDILGAREGWALSALAGKFLCWGDVGLDLYLDEDRPRPGGCALNVARSLVLAGASPVACAGAVGEDGRGLLELLAGWGVGVDLLEVRPGASPRQRIRLSEGERELCGHDAGVLADHEPSSVAQHLAEAEVVYVPCFDGTLSWAEAAWDLGLEGLVLDLMDLADVDEAWIERAVQQAALVFAGLEPGHRALPLLRRLAARPGSALVVATLGAAGASAFAGDRELAVPAAPLPAPLVDTTGCGDAFAGTFVAHWRGGSLEEALRAAGERAAQVATHRGAVLPSSV